MLFFFNDTATTEIYTLSLHDALPISPRRTTCAPGSRTTPVPSSRSRSTCVRSSNGRRKCWTHRIGGPGTGEQKGSREPGSGEQEGEGNSTSQRSSGALMCAGKPAARHVPVNGQSTAASAVSVEPRLQPRTSRRTPLFPTGAPSIPTVRICPRHDRPHPVINDQRRVDVAGKPAARHVPVNGQCTAASAVSAEPRLQPRTHGSTSPFRLLRTRHNGRAPDRRLP